MKVAIVALVIALLAIVSYSENYPCQLTDEGIEACRASVTGGNPVPPSDACCKAISKADLKCLCNYKTNYPWLLSAYKIDPNLAMQLPVKCKIVDDSFRC